MAFARHTLVENNIVSRSGWGPNSWTSNISIYGVYGNDHVVRGNVSFHAVDTSTHQTDGGGYVLDLSIDWGSARFENNIGFMNGGGCVTITDSGAAQIVGNTCFHNRQAIDGGEYSFTDTCRKVVTHDNSNIPDIPVDEEHYSLFDVVYRNNVGIARSGRLAEKRYACLGDSD